MIVPFWGPQLPPEDAAEVEGRTPEFTTWRGALAHSDDTTAIPVIILTCHCETIDPQALRAANVREVCSKPFSARAIVTLAAKILTEQRDP